jgi:hypothetical protein
MGAGAGGALLWLQGKELKTVELLRVWLVLLVIATAAWN